MMINNHIIYIIYDNWLSLKQVCGCSNMTTHRDHRSSTTLCDSVSSVPSHPLPVLLLFTRGGGGVACIVICTLSAKLNPPLG